VWALCYELGLHTQFSVASNTHTRLAQNGYRLPFVYKNVTKSKSVFKVILSEEYPLSVGDHSSYIYN
jgi:hypothetical protein